MRLWSYGATGLRGYEAMELWDYGAMRLWDYGAMAMGLWSYGGRRDLLGRKLVTRLQGSGA